MDRRETGNTGAHLVIVGGGSAAFAAALRAHELGARVTMINDGLPMGGTCVNVGCVPSKTLIRAAEAHHRASRVPFAGIESRSRITDFRAVIEQKRRLVRELRQARYADVLAGFSGVRFVDGRGRLAGPGRVVVDGEAIEADRILVATGARPKLPGVPGLGEAGVLTNETAFELDELPESLIVLGGRYVALECAQMFARFGSRVVLLQRSSRILPTEAPDLTDALTGHLEDEGVEVVTDVDLRGVAGGTGDGEGLVVEAVVDGAPRTFEAAQVLAGTGRRPNTGEMGLEETGVELDGDGFLAVDDTLQTAVPGIYGAGDVVGDPMYVYTAAYEGALAAANALSDRQEIRDYTALPWVIFTDPQVAGVGLDERQAAERGVDADVATLPLSHVPRAIAARDTRGFVRLVRDRATERLLGARILAPEGSELLMELSLAIRHGLTTRELADSFHPYLTLGEAVKLAAVSFETPVEKLSCCAA